MMRRLTFFLLLIFSFQKTFACDCKMAGVSMETISKYELIFVGKVVAISGCDDGTAKAYFTVEKLFRGKSFPATDLEFDCSSDCQMTFIPGQTWIIYATYAKYGHPKVHFCSYSRQQFPTDATDYNSAVHGMNFSAELSWLEKNLGLQKLNEKDIQSEMHHENIRPEGYAFFWYYGFGLLGLIVIYFITKKFLK
jgi:hypothetical protein